MEVESDLSEPRSCWGWSQASNQVSPSWGWGAGHGVGRKRAMRSHAPLCKLDQSPPFSGFTCWMSLEPLT